MRERRAGLGLRGLLLELAILPREPLGIPRLAGLGSVTQSQNDVAG